MRRSEPARVQGVSGVAQEITVELPFENKRSDDVIAAAVLDRLAWNVMLPADAIKVKVEHGYVTLTGDVDWHYQIEAATHDAQRLHGVIGVTNSVKVKPRIDTAEISDNIKLALKRSWYTRPDSIAVTAKAGKVKLTGVVHSPHARRVAAETAWNALGTTSVETI